MARRGLCVVPRTTLHQVRCYAWRCVRNTYSYVTEIILNEGHDMAVDYWALVSFWLACFYALQHEHL